MNDDSEKMALHMTRRAALQGTLATAAVASMPVFARAPRKPNILFIMADDLGYADLSCYGRPDYQTPSLDRLASQGMRFTSAYANSAVCSPTRAALITGRYQYRIPVGLEEPLAFRKVGLEPGSPTLPSLLKKLGYSTTLIGKWHLGELPDYGPQKSGYDEFWGVRSGGVDYFTHESATGDADLWDGDTQVHEVGYLTDLLADRTIAALRKRADTAKPWLISLHLTAPHWPFEGPDDKEESDRLDASPKPAAILHYDGGTMKTYAAMVTRMDYQVGRILETLQKLGMDRNTVVVFTSDNGGERFSTVWPFTGRKGELLEGGLRIPGIVRWPGVAKPGTSSDIPIMSMDWLPTFLTAAGGAPDPAAPTDGMDLRHVIAGGSAQDRTLFWRFKAQGQEAARDGKWKYLKIGGNTFLFDIIADPMERANLKDREPAKFAELAGAWKAWNATMLPTDTQEMSSIRSGDVTPDRYGIEKPAYHDQKHD